MVTVHKDGHSCDLKMHQNETDMSVAQTRLRLVFSCDYN